MLGVPSCSSSSSRVEGLKGEPGAEASEGYCTLRPPLSVPSKATPLVCGQCFLRSLVSCFMAEFVQWGDRVCCEQMGLGTNRCTLAHAHTNMYTLRAKARKHCLQHSQALARISWRRKPSSHIINLCDLDEEKES